jgi:hypothetical protein
MSWSFGVIGTPAAIVQELGKIESGLTGLSLDEFREARPSIEALVRLNSSPAGQPTLHIDASGHASMSGGAKVYSTCSVHIRSLGGRIVTEAAAATEPATTA